MTQTFATPSDIVPMVAMTVVHPGSGFVRLHYFAMTSVEVAREEMGPTWEDARNFVLGVTCTECGTENGEIECIDCGERGCRCDLGEDAHDGEWRCDDCSHPCVCRECTD